MANNKKGEKVFTALFHNKEFLLVTLKDLGPS